MNETVKRSTMEISVEMRGLLGLLELNKKYYPQLELYSISGDWIEDKDINIIKCRGLKGDLIIELI